ncbi:Ku protein [Streptomyces sp. SA15]|uniref:Ku protein n=1 Tax=Streptomyces sp. SA15 TaxID=934019 RepID=UPI00211C51BE|nr:Ku protein [Streptomyces sp. SA15]
MVEALKRSSRVAIAKWAWHGRERLGLLRVRENTLVMHLMHWPDEVRDPSELLPPPVEVSEEELQEAERLIESLTVDELKGDEFRDEYTEAIAQIIEAKREDREPPVMPEPEQPRQIVDLMTALKESVQKARVSRGEDAEVHELPEKTAAKKTARKQPAKKTAAKKAAAKKTSGRRPRSA